MENLGQKLHQAREAKGWTLDEAAAKLKIQVRYLKSIEADDVSGLPGSFFYRSFVRQYATLLGIEDHAVAQYLQDSMTEDLARAAQEPPPSYSPMQYEVPPLPTAGGDRKDEAKRVFWRVALLVLMVTISSGVYVFWKSWSSTRPDDTAKAAPPDTTQAQTPPPQPTPAVQPPLTEQPKDESVQPSQPAGESAQPEATPAAPPAAEPKPLAGAVRLTLTAKEDVWVDAWNQDGKRIFSNVIRAGDTKSLAADGPLRLRYGNAGGLQVEWNGKLIEPPGPRGQIRTWNYGADGYKMEPVIPKTAPMQTPQA